MTLLTTDEDPVYLRQRANRLRQAARGVFDDRALAELGRFIGELEAKADELAHRRNPERTT